MEKIRISKYNVLLADDEPLLRQALSRKITDADPNFHIACECGEGKSALDALKKNSIQVVFTDIRMPEMDGLSLAEKIHELYPGIITVILTGYADFSYAREAIRHGVFEYLLKPVKKNELEQLLSKVSGILQKYYELPEDDSYTGKSAEEIARSAEKYMREHFREEIDLGELSDNMGVSGAYFSKVFTKYNNEPPQRFLTGIRMEEAKRLLSSTDEPIARVGELSGYPDQFYFSRTFRKETGENPSAYRKKYRG